MKTTLINMSTKNVEESKCYTNMGRPVSWMKRYAQFLFIIACFFAVTSTYANPKKYTRNGCTVYWELSKDGTLTISGDGPMPNFDIDDDKKWKTTPPWYSKGEEIVKVVVEDGVSSVGNYAFFNEFLKTKDNKFCNVTSVVLPGSLRTIGNYAFYGSGISNIQLKDGLLSIGECAFMNTALVEITIPLSVTKIGSESFRNANQLTRVTLSDNMTDIPQMAFYDCNIDDVKFPKTLKTIGKSAFQNCNLKEIILPKTVESIETHAFLNNKSIKKIYIPYSVTRIGDEAFGNHLNPFNGLVLCMPNVVDDSNVSKLGISTRSLQQYLSSIRDDQGNILLESKPGRTITQKTDHVDGTVFYIIEENGCKGVVDNNGRWVVPSTEGIAITREHRMSDGGAYYEVTDKGYKGIISNDGRWIIHTNLQYGTIKEIMDDNKTYYIVTKGNDSEYGLMSADGKALLTTGYDFIEVDNGFIRYKVNGYFGVADTSGNTIIPSSRGYTYIGKYVSNEGIFHYSLPGYKGVCDNMGNELTKNIVEPQGILNENKASNNPSTNGATSSDIMNVVNYTTTSPLDFAQNNNIENSASILTTVAEHKDETNKPQPTQTWVQCFACSGDGDCFTCHGQGYMNNGKDCSSCHGRGLCTICAGNGGHNEIQYK